MNASLGTAKVFSTEKKEIVFRVEIVEDSLVMKIDSDGDRVIEFSIDDPYDLDDIISLLDDSMNHALRM
jgi:hypothetical protein